MLYGTTDKFLRVFGLNSLDELPQTETILPANDAGDQLSIAVEEQNGDAIEEESAPAAEAVTEAAEESAED